MTDTYSNSNYGCYIGVFSLVFGLSFNVFYINNLIYNYENRINTLERLSSQHERTIKHLKYKISHKYEDISDNIKLLDVKIETLDTVMNGFIEENKEFISIIETQVDIIKNSYYSPINTNGINTDNVKYIRDMNDSDSDHDSDVFIDPESIVNWSMV